MTLNNNIAEKARASLAGQAFNYGKGFDKTNIESLDPAIIENIVTLNDLSLLTPKQQSEYIKMLCDSLGLNPLSKPLQLVEFETEGRNQAAKKKTLRVYATKDCTEQLRKINLVSVTKLEKELIDSIFFVTVYVIDKDGRTDVATGAVSMLGVRADYTTYPLTGQTKANAMMKAETKAKRRATLSVCGLGFLDESEIEAIPGALPTLPGTDDTIDKQTPEAAVLPELPVIKNTADGLKTLFDMIDKAASPDDLNFLHAQYIDVFAEQSHQPIIDRLNNKLLSFRTEEQTAADTLAMVKDLIDKATTRAELSDIHDNYVKDFKPEAILNKFKELLNKRREEIKTPPPVSDDKPTKGGLFQKKTPVK